MKKILNVALISVVILFSAQNIKALSFSDPIDFTGKTQNGITYLQIDTAYNYTHTLTGLSSSLYNLTDAQLSLTHWGNGFDSTEIWFSYSDGNILIGQLSPSNVKIAGVEQWKTDLWNLSSGVLTEMEGTDPWSLVVKLMETTPHPSTEHLWLDESILTGNYVEIAAGGGGDIGGGGQQIPEPGTILLLGSGLLSIAFYGGKRFRK